MNRFSVIRVDIETGLGFGLPVAWKPIVRLPAILTELGLIVSSGGVFEFLYDKGSPLLRDRVAGRHIEAQERQLNDDLHPTPTTIQHITAENSADIYYCKFPNVNPEKE